MNRRRLLGLLAVVLCAPALLGLARWNWAAEKAPVAAAAAKTASESQQAINAADERLATVTRYLASDELEGRGIETPGLDKAADYIAQQFKGLGLKTDLFAGTPFQNFKITTGAKLADGNTLEFYGPTADGETKDAIKLELGKDYTPLAVGAPAKLDMPLVFVGYGITAKQEGYDDYAGLDVKDKAVIILRHAPGSADPHGGFGPLHSGFRRKISNAYEHGASAVIFVNDKAALRKSVASLRQRYEAALKEIGEEDARFNGLFEPDDDLWKQHLERVDRLAGDIKKYATELQTADDPLVAFDEAGLTGDVRTIPILWAKRRPIERVIKQAIGTTLEGLELAIEKGPTPKSRELKDWTVRGEVKVDRQETEIKNVAAILPGVGPKSNEAIVIGAHYDHLGHGEDGTAEQGSREIHNGADDNASGVATLIEVARRLSSRGQKLPRTIIFLAFTGEERGLLGSAHYVRDPLVPLDKTVAMLNMDMVGRLTDDKLIVYGTDTASEFAGLVERLGKSLGFDVAEKLGGFGPSDHSSFYAQQIPVLHFFTGSHGDYHRSTDDFSKLNVDGMRRVGILVADVAAALADASDPPHFQQSKAVQAGGGGDRPYFGSIPDFSSDAAGYALSGVSADSPADKAGIKAKDVILRLGDSRIGNLEDFDSALRKYKAGDKVAVVVLRGKDEITLTVTLDPPK